ncbi:MAG: hypothetical protein Sapg2KO_26530 [Saprospiraceae bacterium]
MSAKEGQEAQFLHTVTEIIEKNIQNDDFSIEQLCQELNLSRTHLHRKIKAATDLSTSLFIRKIRLEKAKELLEKTDHNISEIAYLTGNKSPQNFSKYFIETYGISPSAYRKKLKTSVQKKVDAIAFDPKRTSASKWQKMGVAGLVLALMCILGFAGRQYFFPVKTNSNNLGSASSSIAILPFQGESRLEDDFLSEGIVEDILAKLMPFENIKVISKASTEQFKDTKKNIQQIGKRLEVQYVLTGKIRANKDLITIQVELIQVADQQLIWTKRYEQPKEELLAMQVVVAENIAKALNQTLDPKLKQRIERIPTSNSEAYTAFLRGRHLMRSRTQENLLKSLDQFLLALDLDPEFSEAYESIARAYHLMINLGYTTAQAEEFENFAEKNILKAIEFNRSNGTAYAILGNLYADQYRWEEAISAFNIALELSPKDALVNYWFSLKMRSIGDFDQALKYHQIASDLDPLHPVIHAGYVYTSALAGDFELANEILQKVEPIMINSFLFYFVKGNLLLRQGDFEGAIPIYEKALELNPSFKPSESDMMYSLGKLGQRQEVLDYLESLDQTRGIDCLRAAKAFMGLEEPDAALNSLKQAADFGVIDDDFLAEPIFASLRNHPIYLDILERYNLAPFADALEFDLN